MAAESNFQSAKFPLGSSVRIKSTGQLEAFRLNGRLRFPPSEKQVAHGGESDAVRRITSSVRGDVLYELEMAPRLVARRIASETHYILPVAPAYTRGVENHRTEPRWANGLFPLSRSS